MTIYALVCFALFLNAAFAKNDHSHIVVITESNFDTIINSNEYVLVNFHRPGCIPCQLLEPQFAKAANNLARDNSRIIFGRVNVMMEKNLILRLKIQGYPTVLFFEKGKPIEYEGGHRESDIVTWLIKQTTQFIEIIDAIESFKGLFRFNDYVILGLTEDTTTDEWKVFEEVASDIESVFVYGKSRDIQELYNFEKGTKIVIIKNFDEPVVVYDGNINVKDLSRFIWAHMFPVVVEFDEYVESKLFQSSIETFFIVFMSKGASYYLQYYEIIHAIGNKYREKVHAVVVDIDNEISDDLPMGLQVQKSESPRSILLNLHQNHKAVFSNMIQFTIEAISDFIDDFFRSQITKHLKSEEIPKDWNKETVKILVGKNFDSVARDKSKAVLVEFYAPWSNGCMQLDPILDILGKEYENKGVIIAKIDATANEVKGLPVYSFPTIKYFPKDIEKVIDYDGDLTLEDIKSFIDSNNDLKYMQEKDEL